MPAAVKTSKQIQEMYSSAFTLSDMEVFIFPELLYALVLANILSPRIWAWREDPWFAGVEHMTFNRQMQRLKQYIMDHYSFNLDLETWGLTTKQREMDRFAGFVAPDIFSRSNALFGYEGDQYYFDVDIRRHFGLDKYTSDVIPYWKTETVEAMDAFVHKEGYARGAGECVSLSALYAAAAFIVLGVPLEDIFILATPLHSQNFIDREDGVLTNNRRILTKGMWCNGSELSTKARRALEKERVTIVSHCTGYVHVDYQEATIDPEAYTRCLCSLQNYLTQDVDFELFTNFLRVHEGYRKHFQFQHEQQGHTYYLNAEVLYRYEHGSKCRIGDASRKKLLAEIDSEEYTLQPDPRRQQIHLIEEKLNGRPLACRSGDFCLQLRELFPRQPDLDGMCRDLKGFTCTRPVLPSTEKTHLPVLPLALRPGMDRRQVTEVLSALRAQHRTVDLAFYANRQIDARGWDYFLEACMERNPVSLQAFSEVSLAEACAKLQGYPAESIYDDNRLATPDEVVNFRRGDGWEKAVCLLNLCKHRHPGGRVRISLTGGQVCVEAQGETFSFPAQRGLALPAREL
ncbi:hypothetical protein JW933_03690 [candidate division FCPU426 bacterium]|nr:hypothetical protein [candidate division FCPU426 bacterium]